MSVSKQTLHPEGDNSIDIYPKTSVEQVEGLEANPTEQATENLEKIRIGDTVYQIPQGGGGGGGSEYEHNIAVIFLQPEQYFKIVLSIITDSNLAINTFDKVRTSILALSDSVNGLAYFSQDGSEYVPSGGWEVVISAGTNYIYVNGNGPYYGGRSFYESEFDSITDTVEEV